METSLKPLTTITRVNKITNMQKPLYTSFLFIIALVCCTTLYSQVLISGPTCVTPGLTYQYRINAVWDTSSTMQVCVSGATINGVEGSCTVTAKPSPFVLVSWNSGATNGSIQLHSSLGDATLNVTIAAPLQAGEIDTAAGIQAILYNGLAGAVHCTAVSGGSCNPVYSYQWQQSTDAVHWSDIQGSTTQHLLTPGILIQTTFFRRKTVESTSGQIVYSKFATVFVGAPPPTLLPVDSAVHILGTAFAHPLNPIK
jgi:hypothetical protein